jgi:hypothetical protein
MKIAMVTEKQYEGKIPSTETNLRVDVTWQRMLDAYHYDINQLEGKKLGVYDAILVIYPKSQPLLLNKVNELTKKYDNIILVQEGPCDYWCEWPLEYQKLFVDVCNSVAGILCHNSSDLFFFQGLTNKPVNMIHTAIDYELISKFRKQKPNEIIFVGAGSGGNWYGGTQSFLAVKDSGKDIVYQKMGRSFGEEKETYSQMTENKVTELPFMGWLEWIQTVSNYKYAIHLMPTVAAGTFSVNLAALGIPVVGNYLIDAQRTCHPSTSVNCFQIHTAKQLINRLIESKDFYTTCSIEAMESAKWFDLNKQRDITIGRIQKILEGKGFGEEQDRLLQENKKKTEIKMKVPTLLIVKDNKEKIAMAETVEEAELLLIDHGGK